MGNDKWAFWVKLTEGVELLGEFNTNNKECWLLMIETFQYTYREGGIKWGAGRRVKVDFGMN